MIILPAIDIQGGRCVRLYQGDFSTVHQVAENPFDTAMQFYAKGAKWIHMVDLDGAKNGTVENAPIFTEIAKHSGLKVELGGGIRDMATIEAYLKSGISRVILGSAAVKNPVLVQEAVRSFGEQIAVGIDAKNEMVVTEGWLDTSEMHYLELAKRMEQTGVKVIIFTDVSKDGTLQGVNCEQLAAINQAISCDIIASGGVRSLEDIHACRALNLYGVICGKSVYSGALEIDAAIKAAGVHSEC